MNKIERYEDFLLERRLATMSLDDLIEEMNKLFETILVDADDLFINEASHDAQDLEFRRKYFWRKFKAYTRLTTIGGIGGAVVGLAVGGTVTAVGVSAVLGILAFTGLYTLGSKLFRARATKKKLEAEIAEAIAIDDAKAEVKLKREKEEQAKLIKDLEEQVPKAKEKAKEEVKKLTPEELAKLKEKAKIEVKNINTKMDKIDKDK